MCSFSASPEPTPKTNRPSSKSCEVAAAWARMAGWILTVGQVTPVVTLCDVVALMAPMTLHTNGLSPWRSIQG